MVIFNFSALVFGFLGIFLGIIFKSIPIVSLSEDLYLWIGISIVATLAELFGFSPKLFFILPLGFIGIIIVLIGLINEKGLLSLLVSIPVFLFYLLLKIALVDNESDKQVA